MFNPLKILRAAFTSVVFTLLTNMVVSCFSAGHRPVFRGPPEEAGPAASREISQPGRYTEDLQAGLRPGDVPEPETCHDVWRITEDEEPPGRRRAARATYTLQRLDLTGGFGK